MNFSVHEVRFILALLTQYPAETTQALLPICPTALPLILTRPPLSLYPLPEPPENASSTRFKYQLALFI